VSSREWILDSDSELNVVIPWLVGEHDHHRRERLLTWIALLVRNPIGRGNETHPGVFSARLPDLGATIIWTFNVERRQVYVADILSG
jgi:hypothetical protein